jgi:hypothetical protein
LWPGTHVDTRLCQYSATPTEGTSRALQYLRAAKTAQVQDEANRRVGLTVPEEMLAQRRSQRPPVRATTEAGSLIIRDPRLWHRGTPNTTDHRRFMLALTYDPTWRSCDAPMELPQGAERMFEAAGLDVVARYVEGPIDHLARYPPPAHSPLKRPEPSAAG